VSDNFDLSALKQFATDLTKKYRVQVGIFGNKDARKQGESTNAYLGSIHEFGWPPSGIPPRSFLRMPLSVKSKEILAQAAGADLTRALLRGDLKLVMKRLGVACEKVVQEAFATRGFGTWRPDKPATVRRKHNAPGDDSPLIDTGQLRRSITSRVVEK